VTKEDWQRLLSKMGFNHGRKKKIIIIKAKTEEESPTEE
jgi:hypothetical protein